MEYSTDFKEHEGDLQCWYGKMTEFCFKQGRKHKNKYVVFHLHKKWVGTEFIIPFQK